MSKLSKCAAPLVPVRVAGQTLLMTPLTLRDYAEIEQVILAERNDGGDPPADVVVSLEEIAEWMCGRGLSYVLWQVLRARQPGLSLDDCHALVASEPDITRLTWQLDRASGLLEGNALSQVRSLFTNGTSLAA